MAEVNTEVQASVILSDQHYHIPPHPLTGWYGTQFQHLPKVIMNLFHQRQRNLPKSFFKGVTICQLDYMLGRMDASQFSRVQ